MLFYYICIRRSLIMMMVIFILNQAEFVNAGEDVIISGDPPIYPNYTSFEKTIDGDLTIQNFDQKTIDQAVWNYFLSRDIKEVTGTVIVRNISARDIIFMPNLEEIGGNLYMHDNPNLERVTFLNNNVTVRGDVEATNSPKLCSSYSYLITLNKKFTNLFDEDCFTLFGEINILSPDLKIAQKKRINGSIICNSTNNPGIRTFDSKLIDLLQTTSRLESLILDDCPIRSLSSTFSSLNRIDSTVKIINCFYLQDDNFDDWLYKIDINHANMTISDNDYVCLEREHVEKWTNKTANISNYKACGELTKDADLNDADTLIPGTRLIFGRIYCINMISTEFSPEAIEFLKNIKNATTLEFRRCAALINLKQIFPNGLPKVDYLIITNCPNFESDLDVLKITKGENKSIIMADNPKMCFSENQLHGVFSGSYIKQREFCGQPCRGGRIAYRKGVMKSNINLLEECDKITGELYFEGELPPKEKAGMLANIRSIEGSLFFNRIKNLNTSRIFDLLPNLQKIDYAKEGGAEDHPKYGCAVTILNVKEIDQFNMKNLELINCGPSKNCICTEGSPEYAKAMMKNDDWPAVKKKQTNVVIYPQNVKKFSWEDINLNNYLIELILFAILLVSLNLVLLVSCM